MFGNGVVPLVAPLQPLLLPSEESLKARRWAHAPTGFRIQLCSPKVIASGDGATPHASYSDFRGSVRGENAFFSTYYEPNTTNPAK
ncbi:MAG: hypothetical protein R3C56_00750 [Pirellulaceae bacterium]